MNEVINEAPAGHNFDPRLLDPFIFDASEELRNDSCFGNDFYLDILAKMRTCVQFDACEQYDIGAVVVYGSKCYEAIAVPPVGDLPTNVLNWQPISKFSDADIQELYDCYLRPYLVFAVLHYAIPSIAYRASTMGVMRNNTEYSESAEDKGVYNLKTDWKNRQELRWRAMHNWLTLVNEDNGINNPERFPLYPANIEEYKCGKDCTPGDDPVNIPFL